MTPIQLTSAERQDRLDHDRRSTDPDVQHRAHLLLLLADGHPWATIRAVLFCSLGTISRWKARFEADGVDAVFGRPRGRRRSGIHMWAALVVRWVLSCSPTEFRFDRSRWSCETAAAVLRDDDRVRVGRGTVRRWLREAGLVWRRPRPVIRPNDPDRERKLRALRALLQGLPVDETAVFMDEVDVNLNPKVGCRWMRRGEQAAVETPGTNETRSLAGSIPWRTGAVLRTEGRPKEGRTAALFCRHRDDLRRALRQYKITQVRPDQRRPLGRVGPGVVAQDVDEWGHRVKVHDLPKYAPDTNPIERVWWRLHEAVTRNHRCRTMDELLDRTFDWFEAHGPFRVGSKVYCETPGK